METLDEEVTPRRGHLALAVAIPVAVVLALFVGLLATRKPATDRQVRTPLLDKLAPAIEGSTLDGASFDLDRLRGEWVLINFFATWCVPCQREHPELEAFQAGHEAAGDAGVVSVVFGDDAASVRAFFAEHGGRWPVIVGDQGRVALDYGVAAVPESYLVDPRGFVRAKIVGGVTHRGVDAILAELTGGAVGGP